MLREMRGRQERRKTGRRRQETGEGGAEARGNGQCHNDSA